MPATRPMTAEPSASTAWQPAVMATSPASEPLSVMETSGFLFLIQVKHMVAVVETAVAMVVFVRI